MKICIIHRNNKGCHNTTFTKIKNNKYTFLSIDPLTYSGMHGERFHTIYCDIHFLDDDNGKRLIKEVFKPMASLIGGKGFILCDYSIGIIPFYN